MSDGSNIREEVAAIIYVSEVFVCLVFFIIIASKTHTEKKQKLHRINKVIKNNNNNNKQRIYTLTWQDTYKYVTAKYVTAVLIPSITVLGMIYN